MNACQYFFRFVFYLWFSCQVQKMCNFMSQERQVGLFKAHYHINCTVFEMRSNLSSLNESAAPGGTYQPVHWKKHQFMGRRTAKPAPYSNTHTAHLSSSPDEGWCIHKAAIPSVLLTFVPILKSVLKKIFSPYFSPYCPINALILTCVPFFGLIFGGRCFHGALQYFGT